MRKYLIPLMLLACIGAFGDTKEELRTAKIAEGYNVQPVGEWALVGEVTNVRKYDVNVEYQGAFFTAQVKVIDDGQPTETAEVIARLETPEATSETFSERLTTFLRSQETGAVFAIFRVEISEEDQTAVVQVYMEATGTVTMKRFVVRERAGVFSFREIV